MRLKRCRSVSVLAALSVLGSLMCGQSPLQAAGWVLPDELTVNVGDVKNVGSNVTVVLTKRSVRADNYKLYIKTPEGQKRAQPFPVSTYRGYVKGDPSMRVNGNIEPGGKFSGNFSEGRDIIGHVTELKIDIPAGGKCTPQMSAGNKVVPLSSMTPRKSPTAGGYVVPSVPMRLVPANVLVVKECVGWCPEPKLETAVSRAEQRINDCDFNWARNVGAAWEIDTLVVEVSNTVTGVQWIEDKPDAGKRWMQFVGFCAGGNGCKGGAAWAAGLGQEAGGVMHEAGHAFGTGHGNDKADAMKGNRAFFGPNNTRVVCNTIKNRPDTVQPAVIYNGALPPQAQDDIAETPKDKPVTIDVLDNDFDGNGDSLSLKSVGTCKKGGAAALTPDKKKVIYTPPAGFVGLDTFKYEVVDSTGCSSRAGEVDINVITDGVAAYFDFDKLEKGNVFTNRGPVGGSACVVRFTPIMVDGVKGKAVYDGINAGWGAGKHMQQITIPDVGDPGPGNLSVSIWVLYPRIHQNMKGPAKKWCASSALVIAHKGAVKYTGNPIPTAPGWAMINRMRFEGFKFMGRTGDSLFDVKTVEKIEPMKWYHLVMVIDRKAQKIRGWVNNKEMTESTETSYIPPGDIADASDLRLMNGEVWQYWQAYPVVIDELKIYNTALTSKQVAELYEEGKNAKVLEPSAYRNEAEKPYVHVPEDDKRFADAPQPKPKETEE